MLEVKRHSLSTDGFEPVEDINLGNIKYRDRMCQTLYPELGQESLIPCQEPPLPKSQAVDCPNVSTIACKYATIFQEFLQDSDLPVWNRFKNTGFWRQLTVREGRTNGNVVDAETFGGIAESCLKTIGA
ncbi:hypothetical protein GYH30_015812 [Glycine max]|uniref:Uncharacterized protein n=2 Tax=Glycine subgen. Soja TaxID=1462606 RepID=A0A0R0JRY7_SOYBN|nr:hypothetical protein GYH30_015812 [Glycine max]